MSIAKSISGTLLISSGFLIITLLSLGVPTEAQTIPSDPQTNVVASCPDTVSSTEFAGWFQTAPPSLNGVVNPADSLNFSGNPNCDFYKWAEQMFLWLTSPAPPTYCGGGAHVFDSPAFFDVSPPDPTSGQRTFIPHACSPRGGVIRFLGLRAAQVGPHGLPVIMDKAGRMLEVERPFTGPSGRPLILSPSGRMVEVNSITLGKDGKLRFLNGAGKAIPAAKPLFRTQFPQTASGKPLVVQKFMVGGRPVFVDFAGNVVEVEQGEAGDNAVLQAQNGSLVYYGIHVNDVYAYFLTGVRGRQVTPGTSFPTTSGDLAQITAFASAHGVTFPDPNALAVEVKTAWVEASKLPDPQDYVTMQATIPTYADTSDPSKPKPNQWTPNGEKTVQLALVGIHVVGSTAGHPEMIWATFEHVGNTPNDHYQYLDLAGHTIDKPRDTSGTWLFSRSNSGGPFNNANMSVNPTTGVITAAPGSTISPSDTIRSKAWGGGFDVAPNPFNPTTAASNSEIISMNNSVRGMMPPGDVRSNYILTGATWTPPGGTPPSGSFPGGSDVGTSKMANTTMETYQQGDNTFATGSNCFDCHGPSITTNSALSHIFPVLQALSTSQILVRVSALTGTLTLHKILVTATNSGTGAPLAGATVTVTDPTSGGKKASGTTAANGTVTLQYSRCIEVVDTFGELGPVKPGRPIVVTVPCDGSVEVPQFAPAGFSAP